MLSVDGVHYLQTRPGVHVQVPVNVAPQKWWQHAVHAVLKEKRQLQSIDATKLSFQARHHLQKQYTRLYQRHRTSKSWWVALSCIALCTLLGTYVIPCALLLQKPVLHCTRTLQTAFWRLYLVSLAFSHTSCLKL